MDSTNEKLAYIKTTVDDFERRIVTGHEAMLRVKFILEHFTDTAENEAHTCNKG